MFDLQEFQKNYEATTPAKVERMKPEKLLHYYNYFSEVRPEMIGRDVKYDRMTENRVGLLEKALARFHNETRISKLRGLEFGRFA